MAKPKPRKRKGGSFPPNEPVQKPTPSPSYSPKQGLRWKQILLFLTIAIGGTYLAIFLRPAGEQAPRFVVEEVARYAHDAKAFTQGLQVHDGFLWESTGRKGESTFRKTELKTGKVIKSVPLPDDKFGEGLTVHGDKFYQLTWKDKVMYVYDKEMNLLEEREYPWRGWGLTSNGTYLIASDGTSMLRFLDPDTLEAVNSIRVRDRGRPVSQLNELEFWNGYVYANSLSSDLIYEIEPKNGDVSSSIITSNLWPLKDRPRDGVMNGIAFNPETKRMLVTGKLCPHIFEVQLKKPDEKR